jgi:hypothetical protein
MNGSTRILSMVLIMGYVAAAVVFITCAKHLQKIVEINRRIDSRLATLNTWLDSAL